MTPPAINPPTQHRGSWVAAILLATAHPAALAQPAPHQVQDYRPIFQECRPQAGPPRLAIRRMVLDGQSTSLTVDPTTLDTSLAPDQTLNCTETNDAGQQTTRYLQAITASTTQQPGATSPTAVLANAGLTRGPARGVYLTADLCPSRRPMDRAFLQSLPTPVSIALSISGTWLTHHRADFQWLQTRQQTGALHITWVDHSYHHPYIPGRAFAQNFLLTPGTDIQTEILDTEKLLIAQGETPSVFFRFPGLISSPSLMHAAADDHLVVLGAAAWLARSPRAHPGDIILIHLNGNEPAGLRIFTALRDAGKLPLPFKPIADAP